MSVRMNHGRTSMTRRRLLALCLAGKMPAEALDTADRERLVRKLWAAGMTDVEIATHTHLTTYTAARIRNRLGLAAHQARKVPA